MNSRHRPTETVASSGKVKKNYCDKQFKKNLAKAMKNVHGEPDNIEKLRGNKNLKEYSEERIINFVNSLSADVQRNVNETDDEQVKEACKLATLMGSICDKERSHEIPLVVKIKSESEELSNQCATNKVNFK
jgi:hypothetical protein